MYLLDTNHCSYIIENNPKVIANLRLRPNAAIGINIITYAELIYMTEKSERQVQNLATVQNFVNTVDLYFIDEETAQIYSRLKFAVFDRFAPKDKNKRRSTAK
ncbi:type II toxin-antitoxin system VapC family toxin [Lusitaniella coriacea]|uniref:type II toxin-antitoxin system VapC family toxin n=1 Tax=Lusitaniella coriacea TaxID=1983105 RepID=UPI003CEA9788